MTKVKLPLCLDEGGKIQESVVPIVEDIRTWLEEWRGFDSEEAFQFAEMIGAELVVGNPFLTVEQITKAAFDYVAGIPSTYAHPNCMVGRDLEIFELGVELAKSKSK